MSDATGQFDLLTARKNKMKTTGRCLGLIGCAGAMLLATGAWAQNSEEEETVPGIRLGPAMRLQPSLGTMVWFTDNRFRSESDEISETGLRFDPSLVLSYAPSLGTYELGYEGQVDPVAEDDYDDHKVFASADVRPLLRHGFKADASYEENHDELGLNRTQGAIDTEALKLDKWESTVLNGEYTFGAPDARVNLSVRGGWRARDYLTNRSLGTKFFDHNATLAGAGATYRVSAKTQLLLDLEHQDIEYEVKANPILDSKLDRALVGVRWAATGKTVGEIMVGYYTRDFDASEREDNEGLDWRAKVIWVPATRTRLTLETAHLNRETHLLGENSINEQAYRLSWKQDWSARMSSDLSVSHYEDDFKGTPREDDSDIATGVLEYELTRRFTIKGGVEYTRRDSSLGRFDFNRTVLFQGFEFVF
ncbi:MAG: outer membrane beta-barrel protein [Panacagrimonas sp.]